MLEKPGRIIDPAFREKLLARDGRCLVCGRFLDENTINPHHILTRKAGGDDTLENGIALCYTCHVAVHAGWIVLDDRRVELNSNVLRWLVVLNLGYGFDPGPGEGEKTARWLFSRYQRAPVKNRFP